MSYNLRRVSFLARGVCSADLRNIPIVQASLSSRIGSERPMSQSLAMLVRARSPANRSEKSAEFGSIASLYFAMACAALASKKPPICRAFVSWHFAALNRWAHSVSHGQKIHRRPTKQDLHCLWILYSKNRLGLFKHCKAVELEMERSV